MGKVVSRCLEGLWGWGLCWGGVVVLLSLQRRWQKEGQSSSGTGHLERRQEHAA